MSDSENLENEHRFPCGECGSDMRFDPDAGQLTCKHCGAIEAFTDENHTTIANTEHDFQAALRDDLPASEMEEHRVSKCENCGAQVEFSGANRAEECPFCASPIVLDSKPTKQIKPKGVLPFALAEEPARDAMTAWLGKLWFAPNNLRDYARKGRKMQGIYVPYWTYDSQTETDYRGQRGDAYYVNKQVTYMDNGQSKTRTERVRKIRWSNKRGHVSKFFDDILILASTSLPERFTRALTPWDLSALKDYSPKFLAGYAAESYVVSLDDGYDQAQHIMEAEIRVLVRRSIGGDEQRISRVDTSLSDITYKHVLLPVWMAAYKYNGKTYRFVVNGQTGKVKGERPWSKIKIAIAVVVGLVVVAGVIFIAQQSK